jgi:pyruvate dehydrogenase E2 component (dihydrolipoamide acetyltransferase)
VHDESATGLLEAEPDAPEPGNTPAAVGASPGAAMGDAGALGDDHASPRRRPHSTSPRARRLAAETARRGRAPAPSTGRFRAIIAERVSESWRTIPHFSVTRQIDVEEVGAALRDLRSTGGAFTFTDLLLRAHAIALCQTGGTVAAGASDIGLAVASEHGVMIPVVRDVLGRSLVELAAARAEAVARGRGGRLTPDELELPPSTLSNLGPLAIDSFTGIIAPGQTSLLTVGRVRRVPCLVDERVIGRDVLSATINADHRTLDGADVARTLGAFATALEHPGRLTEEGPVRA